MNKENKTIKFNVTVQCSKCKKDIKGDMTLKHDDLTIIGSSGFLIFDDVVCNNCNADFRDDFDSITLDVCKELGITPQQIGLDMKWKNQ
jgi:hypothetical protein